MIKNAKLIIEKIVNFLPDGNPPIENFPLFFDMYIRDELEKWKIIEVSFFYEKEALIHHKQQKKEK